MNTPGNSAVWDLGGLVQLATVQKLKVSVNTSVSMFLHKFMLLLFGAIDLLGN